MPVEVTAALLVAAMEFVTAGVETVVGVVDAVAAAPDMVELIGMRIPF
jgi:hypothetical protein